jgi:hypothetical protein
MKKVSKAERGFILRTPWKTSNTFGKSAPTAHAFLRNRPTRPLTTDRARETAGRNER